MYKIKAIIIFFIILHSISFTKETNVETNENKKTVIEASRKEKTIIKQSIENEKDILKNLTANKEEELLIIEIEKIKLKQPVYKVESAANTVDKNVAIMKESSMPNIKFGNLILGAHSGNGPIAYFNNLIELNKNDEINITYANKTYTYLIANIYDDIKDNKVTIRRDLGRTALTLFTCKNNDSNKYLVIIAYLKETDRVN